MKAMLALLLSVTPVLADQNTGSKTVECFCTDSGGNRIELGQTICLQVDGRMFMAQCQMSLNVPMWREVAQGCYNSSLSIGQAIQPPLDPAAVHTGI